MLTQTLRRTLAAGLIGLALGSGSAQAQNHADPWLRMGVGARAMAMGTAQTAAVEDATAAYWNPAMLPTLHAFEASLMYTAGMKAERSYNYLSAAYRLERLGTLGISWTNAGITGVENRDAADNYLGSFDVSQNAFQLSFGRKIAGGLSGGVSAKYLQEDLGDNRGYGIDVGLLFRAYDELQFGAMVRDASGRHGKDDVPYEARAGAAVKPWQPLTIAADFVKERDREATAAIGASYRAVINDHTAFWLGAGRNDVRASRGFTAGFGLDFTSFAVQYAYVTEPETFLDANHRVSVNFYLGESGLLPSLFGAIRQPSVPREQWPKEYIHRYIFEGGPPTKAPCDSIRTVWAEAGGIVSFPGVNFAIGSAEITQDFARVLDGAAELIAGHPEVQFLEIQGHTDNTGGDAINNPLSQARAESVRNYLISRGVDGARLTAKGFGSTQPVADNGTEQGRYQNRRIDMVRVR